MRQQPPQISEHDAGVPTRREELRAFFILTAVVAPVLAVLIVAGYGFFVWMYQLFTGDLPGAL